MTLEPEIEGEKPIINPQLEYRMWKVRISKGVKDSIDRRIIGNMIVFSVILGFAFMLGVYVGMSW